METPEQIIIRKNKTIRRIRILLWSLLITLSVISFCIPFGLNMYILAGWLKHLGPVLLIMLGYPLLTIGIGIAGLMQQKKTLTRLTVILLVLPIMDLVFVLIAFATGWLHF